MEELTLTTPALLFSAVSLILLAYTNRFLSYAQLVRQLRDRYMENPSDITVAQIENLRKRLNLTRTMQGLGIASLFFLRSEYVSDLYRTAIIIRLCLRTGFDSADRISGRIFPRDSDFYPFAGDLSRGNGKRTQKIDYSSANPHTITHEMKKKLSGNKSKQLPIYYKYIFRLLSTLSQL